MDSHGPDPQRNGSAPDRAVTADEDRRRPCTAIAAVTVCGPLQSGGGPEALPGLGRGAQRRCDATYHRLPTVGT